MRLQRNQTQFRTDRLGNGIAKIKHHSARVRGALRVLRQRGSVEFADFRGRLWRGVPGDCRRRCLPTLWTDGTSQLYQQQQRKTACKVTAGGMTGNMEKGYFIGVTGFEPATSSSQTTRATNCATLRLLTNLIIYSRRLVLYSSRGWKSRALRNLPTPRPSQQKLGRGDTGIWEMRL